MNLCPFGMLMAQVVASMATPIPTMAAFLYSGFDVLARPVLDPWPLVLFICLLTAQCKAKLGAGRELPGFPELSHAQGLVREGRRQTTYPS